MARILIVDDEPSVQQAVSLVLGSKGFDVVTAAEGRHGIELLERTRVDVAVVDLILPDMTGVDLLTILKNYDPELPCVVITAHASVRSAVDAMKAGAYDYIAKPFDNDHLILTVRRALERRQLSARVTELETDLSASAEFTTIVGRSEAIRDVLRRMRKAAASDVPVLLTGETGTGKELAALSLHRAGSRKNGPFVAVNCPAIPPMLAESELFGHVAGAFTDARSARIGKFEEADGGTLFLDEVGDLSLEVQVKLLRAIQEGVIHRVGSNTPRRVNARIISATNRDLSAEVAAGRFRSDLFWRLNVVELRMPPLRERSDDIPILVSHLLDRANAECRTKVRGVDEATATKLKAYSWPGNVRELANVIRHGVVMTDAEILTENDLPAYLSAWTGRERIQASTLSDARALTERQLLEATLHRFQGNRTAAAKALGIDRRTLYTKLRRLRNDGNL